MTDISDIMQINQVIPVLVIDELEHAVPIAQALVAGGLRVIEVTLRTPCAFEAIRAIRSVEGAIVGAGTVTSGATLDQALEAGSEFVVSPGLTGSLASAAIQSCVPFLPGIATASDIMRGLELGLMHFKFFPATASGGVPALKALTAPFSQCRFCPTGGISAISAPEWLKMDSVLCVGGSGLVPPGPPDLAAIEALALQASQFR